MMIIIQLLKSWRKLWYKRQVLKTAASIVGPVYVNGLTYVNSQTHLGSNINFNGLRIVGKGEVVIGDNFHSGMDCVIIPSTHNYRGVTIPYDATYIEKKVIIEDNVWLGHGVMIMGGVTIGEGAILQAGSIVVKDIPKLAIAGGNPATPFKFRDSEHYYRLKEQGKFH
jgi:acetyltransferase-like isoleucine patch superfamily enzyme